MVVNLAPHPSQCYAPLAIDGSTKQRWVMNDLLGTEQYPRDGDDLRERGLFLDLSAHKTQLFRFRPET
jgi:hypothetical protein